MTEAVNYDTLPQALEISFDQKSSIIDVKLCKSNYKLTYPLITFLILIL